MPPSAPFRRPAALAALLLALGASPALAHNLGRTLFAHTVEVEVDRGQATLVYEVEVPTPSVMRRYYLLYRETEGKLPREEMDKRFTREMLEELAGGLTLRGGDAPLAATLGATEDGTTGLGNLQFFRYKLTLTAPLPLPADAGEGLRLEVRNGNFVGESAVFRTTVRAAKGLEIVGTNLPPDADPKDFLVDEVTGLRWSLKEAHRVARAEVRKESLGSALRRLVASGAPAEADAQGAAKAPQPSSAREGRLFDLLRSATLTPPAVALALGLAFVLGAMHALTPGHGKTLVAAYLVGSRGTVGHAVLLGGIVTFTHTFTVVLLGLAALLASSRFAPERIGPVLGAVSGVLIVGVGIVMFRRLLRGGGHGHSHDGDGFRAADHDHADGKDHGHVHAPPEKVTAASLVALGVSGGLVPCPSAMVLLLTAVALQRAAFGLTLVVSFSVGLALVLIGLGVLLVTAKDLAARIGGEGGLLEAAARRLPLVSATAVTVLGLVITWKSLAEAGGMGL